MLRRAVALLAGMAAAIAACGTFADTRTDLQNFAEIEKGRYLVSAADCVACHTVWPNGARFAGGRPIETPFGNIVSANITPDGETGIGSWSDDQFDDAVRRGIRPNGARLYPAMPYPYYTKMSREDVLAIRAYLKTVEPVRNPVVTNTLPFPFNIRTSMRVWNVLFSRTNDSKPIRRNRMYGIAVPFSSRAPATAAPATRRKIFWAGTSPANTCVDRTFRTGLPRTSPMMSAAAWAAGRSTRSPNFSNRATTGSEPPLVQWPKR
jgi:mono/diheme cytochrome c family protein